MYELIVDDIIKLFINKALLIYFIVVEFFHNKSCKLFHYTSRLVKDSLFEAKLPTNGEKSRE